MLMNSPEAAAHKAVRNVYLPPAYYHVDARRSQHMPRWLERDRAFCKWYKRTQLKRDRRLAWNQLFDIYRWEKRRGGPHYRGDRDWSNYYRYRYRYRDHDHDHDHDHDRHDRNPRRYKY
jgi:hypothetical protein